ncbi:UDP-galactose translocator 1 [Trichinella spiralis]|uniref:UDP-galactose translocator 1 n=1 Tax=Trichinella spiralis TaxID=6334 RepID=A0A0V1BZ16_TRISP|nr:UDP-galactose translocator 1 [Trichinella spiralis]
MKAVVIHNCLNDVVKKDGMHGKLRFRKKLFHFYLIGSMTTIWSAHSLLLRHTQMKSTVSNHYLTSTVVLIAELVKLVTAVILLLHETKYHISSWILSVRKDFFCAPYEMLKMSIPSICYAVQNNLEFYGLANMNAATYVKCMKYVDFSCINEGPYRLMSNNKYKMSRLKKFSEWHCVGRMVMTQFKVVTTAIFMVLLLGRSFSCRRWIAICLVSVGVSMAYLGTVNGKVEDYNQAIPIVVEKNAPNQSLLIGLSVVTINCFLAGFAGVYCEVMLKNSSVSLWIRNMQLYTCGLISAAIACWLTQSNEIKTFGFFHGYNALIFLIAGLQSAGGLYVSMVMKYLDNLMKSFAAAFSIIIVSIFSVLFLEGSVSQLFCLGAFVVCAAIVLYNSVSE